MELPIKVKVDQQMLEEFRQIVKRTPYPDESTVDDDDLSPNRMLECLEVIARTGIIETEQQYDLYTTLKAGYDSRK